MERTNHTKAITQQKIKCGHKRILSWKLISVDLRMYHISSKSFLRKYGLPKRVDSFVHQSRNASSRRQFLEVKKNKEGILKLREMT